MKDHDELTATEEGPDAALVPELGDGVPMDDEDEPDDADVTHELGHGDLDGDEGEGR